MLADPEVLQKLAGATLAFRSPSFELAGLTWKGFTLGNAIIATADEKNRLFPDRPVNENRLSTSTGVLNVFSATVGGIPMCHGAGGMAGHAAFGARTGGATVILGVILVITGAQLALGSCDFSDNKVGRLVTLLTAAFCIWNVGLGFAVGMAGAVLIRHGLLKL